MITPMPKGLKVDEMSAVFTITRKWFSMVHVFLFIFSFFWNGFLFFWYAISLNELNSGDTIDPVDLILVFAPIIHVIGGIGMLYFAIAGFVNKTKIEILQGEIIVKSGPMPWPGNKRIKTHQIIQLYSEEKTGKGKSGNYTAYNVNVVLNNNKKIPLVKNLIEKDQAIYIESKIEKRLGIKDSQVAGEVEK